MEVVLHDVGSNKIHVIKLVREATGLGLKESKDLVEPRRRRSAASPDSGGRAGRALEKAGARASASRRARWEAQDTGGAGTVAARQEVWERDGGRCVRCGAQQELQYDHIIPLSRGGADTAENLQLLCAPCSGGPRATAVG